MASSLESSFNALRERSPEPYNPGGELNYSNRGMGNPMETHYPTPGLATTGQGGMGLFKEASGVIYTQPQFFSPMYTPINWQIPSKRREIMQWARFYYENEPKVASAIDFYSVFPINGFQLECPDREIKDYYEKLNDRLELERWLKVISHEYHLLGDCFPFLEIACERCHDSGMLPDGSACDHKGGEFKRIVILNPEYVEVYTTPISPDPVICLIPDDELKSLITQKKPGHEKLLPRAREMILQGKPIPLDNLCVSHLKFGESGYNRYGVSMVKRLFPILAYKTKLMTAQWIVAERLILPIKVVKVGNDERPASATDIASVQSQLAATANDPNLTLVTHHAFELEWYGAAGKVLTLTNEFELIAQEELDGLMLNKSLLNGEGPTYSNAAIGIEVMIHRLEQWRNELARWVEKHIYLPVAKMKGFIEKNEFGQWEYIYPRIKWNIMHLRDQQNYRQSMIQLYEKGVISTKRLLDAFDIDFEEEVEILRFERAQGNVVAPQQGGGGMGGGMGGGFGGGGLGDLGGIPPMGGEPMPVPEGALGGPPGDIGAASGGMGGESPSTPAQSDLVTNIGQFSGKVLTRKTREKIKKQQEQLFKQYQQQQVVEVGKEEEVVPRTLYTSIELTLLRALAKERQRGSLKYVIVPHYKPGLKSGSQLIEIDFAIPDIKVGIEADGILYHSSPQQINDDNKRDAMLAQSGWTILRFKDKEIERRLRGVIETILQTIQQKEHWIKEKYGEDNKLKESKQKGKTTNGEKQ